MKDLNFMINYSNFKFSNKDIFDNHTVSQYSNTIGSQNIWTKPNCKKEITKPIQKTKPNCNRKITQSHSDDKT